MVERGWLTGWALGCRGGPCHGLREEEQHEVCPWELSGRGGARDAQQLCPVHGHQGQGQPPGPPGHRGCLGAGTPKPFLPGGLGRGGAARVTPVSPHVTVPSLGNAAVTVPRGSIKGASSVSPGQSWPGSSLKTPER